MLLKITQAQFVISAVRPEQYPDDALPEIALAGRSNVGKSSLINKMIQRKNLARTSSTPGKTQQLNYYRINDSLYFVDFPGYGYAKVSKTQRYSWGLLIEKYLLQRAPLKLVMQLIDVRHPPSKDDERIHQWLREQHIPLCVVATKIDKISRNHRDKHMKIIKQSLDLTSSIPLVAFSAQQELGVEQLWKIIRQYTAYENT